MRTVRTVCLIAGIACCLSAIAQTPEQDLPASKIPTLKVNTSLTIEYVTVTDSKGHPVHGLTESDFTVKEDGKDQPIKNFEEHGTAKAGGEGDASPGSSTVSPGANAAAGAPTVLMFDRITSGRVGKQPPELLDYAKKQSQAFVRTMPEGTKVAILELGDTLRLVQGFTSDRKLLLDAVDSIKYQPVDRAYVEPPIFSVIQPCEAANNQSQLVLNGLGYAAAGLSRTEGRKNLIWFTPGIPWLTDYRLYRGISCINDYTPQLHDAYSRLAAGQVVLYPVDPRGVVLASGAGGAAASGPQSGASLMAFSTSLYDQNNSMRYFAEATGGKAYYSRNDLATAIGEVVAAGSDYYAIAYVTPPSKNGKYHSIKVTVDRPALKLEYREGYTSVDEKQAKTH